MPHPGELEPLDLGTDQLRRVDDGERPAELEREVVDVSFGPPAGRHPVEMVPVQFIMAGSVTAAWLQVALTGHAGAPPGRERDQAEQGAPRAGVGPSGGGGAPLFFSPAPGGGPPPGGGGSGRR